MELLRDRIDSTAILTLNRPERRNALSLGLMRTLTAAFRETAADPQIKAVILAATGPVFSSGHDLGEMRDASAAQYRETFAVCTELMETIQRIPQPVIAEVQGLATAAGCQLAATCDLTLASDMAGFATPGVKIGLFCTTPMVALTRAIGRKRAMEMLLTGRIIDAETAVEWGLANRAVPPENLRVETLDVARQIAQASTYTVGLGKQAFYDQIDLDQSKAYAYAKEVMTLNALAGDAREGIGAFLDRRVPCWQGR